MKRIEWLGDSRERIRGFPSDARRQAGYQLGRVQAGDEPADWKPMPSIGQGANEIRVRAGAAYRVVYVAKFAEAVYVLHVFQKKSSRTPKADIELARLRLGLLIQERRQR